MENTTYTYIDEASVIPQNFSWRAGINAPTARGPVGDQGAAMAQAFVQSLQRRPPQVDMPRGTMSKEEKMARDILNYMAPIPTFGVEDTTPETRGEMEAMRNPVYITDSEPLNIPTYQEPQRYRYVGL